MYVNLYSLEKCISVISIETANVLKPSRDTSAVLSTGTQWEKEHWPKNIKVIET